MNREELTAILRLIEAATDAVHIQLVNAYKDAVEYAGPNEILQIMDDSELGKLCAAKAHLMIAWEALTGKKWKERNNGDSE